MSLFVELSKLALGVNQPLTQWVPEALSTALKLSGRQADHSTAASAEDKNVWSCTTTLPCLHGVVINEESLQFNFFNHKSKIVSPRIFSPLMSLSVSGDAITAQQKLRAMLHKSLLVRKKGGIFT
jgi:hypothetical protein